MYYEWDRYVVYKDFNIPIKVDLEDCITLPNTSFEMQNELFEKGYIGFKEFKSQDGIKIVFGKKMI
jgi:hypothetical protein